MAELTISTRQRATGALWFGAVGLLLAAVVPFTDRESSHRDVLLEAATMLQFIVVAAGVGSRRGARLVATAPMRPLEAIKLSASVGVAIALWVAAINAGFLAIAIRPFDAGTIAIIWVAILFSIGIEAIGLSVIAGWGLNMWLARRALTQRGAAANRFGS
ncbi:MAG TPA: hypothetical protein VHI13_22775 [Candidatus Kapabacteria bacterium]|nr:hypothetical protein [Candidatus Kapabacteria bacterium]